MCVLEAAALRARGCNPVTSPGWTCLARRSIMQPHVSNLQPYVPWQFDVSRAALKREGGDPSLHRFWAWLVRESEQGRVQRQEAVSMVPPLLLDVQRGHQVL